MKLLKKDLPGTLMLTQHPLRPSGMVDLKRPVTVKSRVRLRETVLAGTGCGRNEDWILKCVQICNCCKMVVAALVPEDWINTGQAELCNDVINKEK